MMIDACKVHGGALAGIGAVHALSAGLNAAYPQPCAGGKQFDFVFGRNMTADQRASHYATETLDCKSAINWQAKIPLRIFFAHFAGLFYQRLGEVRKAFARLCADWNYRCAFQKRSAQKVVHLHSNQLERLAIHQINLGQSDQAALNSQQPANIEMLASLRLDGFVSRNYQKN